MTDHTAARVLTAEELVQVSGGHNPPGDLRPHHPPDDLLPHNPPTYLTVPPDPS